jgi:TorA maturation chaperone TorD
VKNSKSVADKYSPAENSQAVGPVSPEASSLKDQRNIIFSREAVYSFLSRIFMFEVDNEFLTMIAAMQPTIRTLAMSQENEQLKEASELIDGFSKKMEVMEKKERDKVLAGLAAEYATLFVIGAGRRRVYPWESAYFSDPPRLFAQSFHQVVDAYKSVGYEKPKEFKDPEDHIAPELAFMAHLCRLARSSIESGNAKFAVGYLKLQKEFLTDHLLKWAGKFCESLKEKSEIEFYRAIGMLMESFLALDSQTLDHMTSELEATRSDETSKLGTE